MERIKESQLQHLVSRINVVTGSPELPWGLDLNKLPSANIGNYHLASNLYGWNLQRMHNASGGVTTPIGSTSLSKREMYGQLYAFLRGIETARELVGA